ncbi:conjugative transfer signal peptidase TraF [Ensifer sp. ENS06]|nr:conjugative transfer signal peptidase TraF [Ensifer sp. ENS06]
MTFGAGTRRAMTTQQSRAIATLSAASAAAILFIATAQYGGYRINLTPSGSLGLWRIVPLYRPPDVEDLVFICPPETVEMREGRARGYLRSGLCPGGVAPFIKAVAAVAGQHVKIDANVKVDGRAIPSSEIEQRDGKGRLLSSFRGGAVPWGYVFLHSPSVGSYDSRYFGPVPASGILGLAEEVFTYAP